MAKTPLTPDALGVAEAELARLQPIAQRLLAGRPGSGFGTETHRSRPGAGTDFLDFQPYGAGSDRRTIDWRASARAGGLVVRRFRREASAEWTVCVDRSASMAAGDGRKWRLAIQAAAALIFLLLGQNKRTALVMFSDGLDLYQLYGRGRGQFGEAAARLAAAAPARWGGGSKLAACLPHLSPGSSTLILSDFLTPDAMTADLELIRRRGVEVHAIRLSIPDIDVPQCDGGVRLVDVESGERLIVVGDGATAAARAELNRLGQLFAACCRRLGVRYSVFEAPCGWQAIVTGHLTRLVRGDA
jgi:uncharacterized protein (DUF58 family)